MLSSTLNAFPRTDRFACCDLDCNGVITSDELRYFYRSQLHRISSLVRGVTFLWLPLLTSVFVYLCVNVSVFARTF